MAGGSAQHNTIMVNVTSGLHQSFRGKGCRVYASDMRVKISSTGLYAYPDVAALCEEPQYADERQDVLVNPSVLVEILSPTTEAYDRGDKFAHYQRLESLREYVLIAQDRRRVEHYVRLSNASWELHVLEAEESSLTFAALPASLSLTDIYMNVTFPPPPSRPAR